MVINRCDEGILRVLTGKRVDLGEEWVFRWWIRRRRGWLDDESEGSFGG